MGFAFGLTHGSKVLAGLHACSPPCGDRPFQRLIRAAAAGANQRSRRTQKYALERVEKNVHNTNHLTKHQDLTYYHQSFTLFTCASLATVLGQNGRKYRSNAPERSASSMYAKFDGIRRFRGDGTHIALAKRVVAYRYSGNSTAPRALSHRTAA
jgi:hypothetical protein